MNRSSLSPCTVLLLLSLLFVGSARAELSLDATFNPGGAEPGILEFDISDSEDAGNAVAVQTDGKPVLVGYTRQPGSGSGFIQIGTAARFNVDGTTDEEFGVDGLVSLDVFGPVGPGDGAGVSVVAINPADQKILLGGQFTTVSARRPFLVRLNTDGTVDTTFGTDGLLLLTGPEFGNVNVQDIALQSDGRILLAGDFVPQARFLGFIIRISADGAVDETFASSGILQVSDPSQVTGAFTLPAIAVLGDDSILAVGGTRNLTVRKYTADGAVDPLFGTDGVVSVNVSSGSGGTVVDSDDVATTIGLYPDGRIQIGGRTRANPNNAGSLFNPVLLRLLADGQIDTGFGVDGLRVLGGGTDPGSVAGLVVRGSGDIVVSGFGFNPTQVSESSVALAPLAGEVLPFPVISLVLDPDGRPVGAGSRFLADGTVFDDFSQVLLRLTASDLNDGSDTTPDAFSFETRVGVALSATVVSGTIVVTGIDAPAPVSVVGGDYSLGCTADFTDLPGTILAAQPVCVRQTAAADPLTSTITTLTIGGVSADFTSTTTPFGDQLNVRLQTTVISNAFALAGLGAPVAVAVANGEYSIGCGGNWTREAGTITNGDTLCLRHVTPAQLSTPTVTTVTLGGTAYTFTSVTTADKPLPGSSAIDPLALLLLVPGLLAGRRRRNLAAG